MSAIGILNRSFFLEIRLDLQLPLSLFLAIYNLYHFPCIPLSHPLCFTPSFTLLSLFKLFCVCVFKLEIWKCGAVWIMLEDNILQAVAVMRDFPLCRAFFLTCLPVVGDKRALWDKKSFYGKKKEACHICCWICLIIGIKRPLCSIKSLTLKTWRDFFLLRNTHSAPLTSLYSSI